MKLGDGDDDDDSCSKNEVQKYERGCIQSGKWLEPVVELLLSVDTGLLWTMKKKKINQARDYRKELCSKAFLSVNVNQLSHMAWWKITMKINWLVAISSRSRNPSMGGIFFIGTNLSGIFSKIAQMILRKEGVRTLSNKALSMYGMKADQEKQRCS